MDSGKCDHGRRAGTKPARPATNSSFSTPRIAQAGVVWIICFEVFKETPAKELTKTNCYLRHSCSKLLLINVIFIWFSDEMLFTLTTLKHVENGIWCNIDLNKTFVQERFFRKNDV